MQAVACVVLEFIGSCNRFSSTSKIIMFKYNSANKKIIYRTLERKTLCPLGSKKEKLIVDV